jgi:hypothetical protein
MDEVLSYMSKETETDSSVVARLELIQRLTERSIRRYVGTNIVQATYTHFLPSPGQCIGKPDLGEVLRLPEYPVRSITTIHEDEYAYAGSAAGAFGSDDLLTSGSDYYLAVDQSGLSWFGHVVRISSTWAAIPGSLKVVYTAGWTADELDGDVDDPRLDASDIKLAVLKTISETYSRAAQQNESGGGRIISEKIDDYFVQYSANEMESSIVNLPMDAKMLLKPFRRRAIG